LELAEEKAARADELVKRIRGTVDPIASKILELGDETARTPGQAKELKRIEEELGKRLNQVDAIAEAAETAVTLLNKTARLTRPIRTPASRGRAPSVPEEQARDRSESLSKLADNLEGLRETIATARDNRGGPRRRSLRTSSVSPVT
jgi:hypothetical protein